MMARVEWPAAHRRPVHPYRCPPLSVPTALSTALPATLWPPRLVDPKKRGEMLRQATGLSGKFAPSSY